ncbi:MAG: lipopolysaccharide biosynthesis protein, partial [Nitrososphaeraceae archaeon]
SKTFVYSADKLIIMPIFGLTILGQYQFGIQILTALSIIPLILYNYLLPQHAGGKSNNKRLGTIELYGVIVSLILTVILILAMPIIVNTFFSGFSNAIISSQIVVCAAIPLSISAICNSILLSRERSSWVIMGAVIFLISQYILIIILGAAFSLEGLAIATVIASVVQAIFLYLARKRTLDKK